MTHSVRISFGFAILAWTLQAWSVNAQDTGKTAGKTAGKTGSQAGGQTSGGLQIAQVSGKMQAMALDKIKIVADDKKEYFAVVSEQTMLNYKGTAEPEFLTPGLFVRFSADVNQSGQAQAPVMDLEVFTVNQHRRMSHEQMREQTAGVYEVGGEVGNAKQPGEKPKEKTDKASAKLKATSGKAGAQAYRVVGQIAQVKAGKMVVQAGGAQVQLELDPKATIKVSSHDMTFCQMGDQVRVSGLRTAGQEQFIQSESLEIVGAKPLGPAEGKSTKNAKGSKTKAAKTGADKDDEGSDKKSDTKKTTPKK